ncbi:MAG: 30S ribosomal protein S7 [Armatimonadetes bacterium JP3_11]|jgi:small subunit ribosomal protein S7|nr:MAG: 30S ribosomal protein S7 [Armatimonadetes bacterium CP1_7O]OYT71873.1 MAG: 30S ribosomal protein S7 [Armatimonadetes bacterium JP3_11]RMH07437.1 MAG: 30S ribosomal protein S7 [Armatimonadota bacterium]
MPRKGPVPKRVVLPDPVYDSELVARFINRMMKGGKKAVAEKVFYRAMEIVEQRTGKPAMEVFEQAIENVAPQVEVRPRRVGGQTYQVPMEVRAERRRSLAIRWIVTSLQRKKSGRPAHERLAQEIIDAYNKTGGAYKKREDTHRMAEANRAFAHYRW